MNAGPLRGFKVVDMSSVVMGPWTTHILADYGAEVVKVEPPEGDISRRAGVGPDPAMGSLFIHTNRGKRCVVLDAKKPAGRDAVLRLCARADVFIHNMRPAATRRLGLDHAAVNAANPRIVYANLVGYRGDGPDAGKPAYDDLIQGRSGLAALFARLDGRAPVYVPALLADRYTGACAAHAVLAALLHRARTGEGQFVELPMFETFAEFVLADHMGGLTYDPPEGPSGYPRALNPFRKPYATSDGFLCLVLYEDKHWRGFFAAAGQMDRFDADPRLHDAGTRRRELEYAYRAVAELLATRKTAEWLDLLTRADLPVAPLQTVDDLMGDPHLAAISFFKDAADWAGRRLTMTDVPSRWSRTQPTPDNRAARPGEHSFAVLRELGYADSEIRRMAEDGVTILDGEPPPS